MLLVHEDVLLQRRSHLNNCLQFVGQVLFVDETYNCRFGGLEKRHSIVKVLLEQVSQSWYLHFVDDHLHELLLFLLCHLNWYYF